jgi:ABC-2 type transport system permease protein
MSRAPGSGAWAVARREWRRARTDRTVWLLVLVLPLVGTLLTTAIFAERTPSNLPVAVCDQDHSALSRRLVRMLDAAKTLAVRTQVGTPADGVRALRRGDAYAVVLLPAGLERDVRRGAAPHVVAWVNNQWLLPGSLVARDLRTVIATASAGAELRGRRARGEMAAAALAHLEPIRVERHPLFNPGLDYLDYLLAALFPALLQIFVVMLAIHVTGSELKHGTAAEWAEVAGNSLPRALLGKLLPYTAAYTVIGLLLLAALFGPLQVPMRGHALVLFAATPLFVLAGQSVALALVAWTANLRLASSLAAFYTGTAFAFAGITFPTVAMPWLGRAWSALLPLTHMLRILVEQTMRGAPADASLGSLARLAAFMVAGVGLAWLRLPVVTREPRFWGRA